MEYSEWWGFYEPVPSPLVEQIAHLIPFNCSRKMCPKDDDDDDCRTMYGTDDPLSLKKVETFGLAAATRRRGGSGGGGNLCALPLLLHCNNCECDLLRAIVMAILMRTGLSN